MPKNPSEITEEGASPQEGASPLPQEWPSSQEKASSEKGHSSETLPKDHQLPIDIQDSSLLAVGGRSKVWRVDVRNVEAADNGTGVEKVDTVILKEILETRTKVGDVLRANQDFYDYLKSFPGFGKFVPETSHFKAKKTADSPEQVFHKQTFIDGTTLDKIKDKELYSNPKVVRQLLEFVTVMMELLKITRKEKLPRPDLLLFPKSTDIRVIVGGLLANPRYTANVVIAKKPDKDGQYVFFVDTAQNVDERVRNIMGIFYSNFSGRPADYFLKRWKI
jgi:hypothetical protein